MEIALSLAEYEMGDHVPVRFTHNKFVGTYEAMIYLMDSIEGDYKQMNFQQYRKKLAWEGL